MRKIKEAIADFAIAMGYDGDNPKSIARAIDTLANVSGGGSGGGGDADVLIVTCTVKPAEQQGGGPVVEADKTAEEICDYFANGGRMAYLFTSSEETYGVSYTVAPIYNVEKYGNGPAEAKFAIIDLITSGTEAGIHVNAMTLQGTSKTVAMANGTASLRS